MTSDPKPCPFCDSEAETHSTESGSHQVLCPNRDCGRCVVITAWASLEDAVARWNTRPGERVARSQALQEVPIKALR